MCRTVTPRAVKARGGGGVTRLAGAATSWTASPWTAAMRATKIQQLSCDLPFQCRTWPTTETKKRDLLPQKGISTDLRTEQRQAWHPSYREEVLHLKPEDFLHNTHVTPATNPRCCHPWYSLLGASLVYFSHLPVFCDIYVNIQARLALGSHTA